MKKVFRVFTPEMGSRLKSLRSRAGLSRAELASRMGLTSPKSRAHILRLEAGKIPDPHLSTISRYLQACGAKASEFFDLLTQTIPTTVDTSAISRAGLSAQEQAKAIRKTKRETRRFQRKLEYPTSPKARPTRPDKWADATGHLARYRVVANAIEAEVKTILEQKAQQAQAAKLKPRVAYYDFRKYLLLARKSIAVLRRSPAADTQDLLNRADALIAQQKLDPETSKAVVELVRQRYPELARNAAQTQAQVQPAPAQPLNPAQAPAKTKKSQARIEQEYRSRVMNTATEICLHDTTTPQIEYRRYRQFALKVSSLAREGKTPDSELEALIRQSREQGLDLSILQKVKDRALEAIAELDSVLRLLTPGTATTALGFQLDARQLTVLVSQAVGPHTELPYLAQRSTFQNQAGILLANWQDLAMMPGANRQVFKAELDRWERQVERMRLVPAALKALRSSLEAQYLR